MAQRGVRRDRAQVGEQAERLPQSEDRLLRPDLRRRVGAVRRTYRPEQHGVGIPRERQGLRGQRVLACVHRGRADRGLDELEVMAESHGHGTQGANGFRRHLGPDAVAGQDGDACLHALRSRSNASMAADCDRR